MKFYEYLLEKENVRGPEELNLYIVDSLDNKTEVAISYTHDDIKADIEIIAKYGLYKVKSVIEDKNNGCYNVMIFLPLTEVGEFSIDDVLSLCPVLSEKQVEAVMQLMNKRFDASSGMNWDVIENIINELYLIEKMDVYDYFNSEFAQGGDEKITQAIIEELDEHGWQTYFNSDEEEYTFYKITERV